MKFTPGNIESEGHVVLTGPITGTVQLDDGSYVDVSPTAVEVDSPEQAAELAHKIGLRYAAEGHPDDVELDPETGEMVQREFVYVAPEDVPDQDSASVEGSAALNAAESNED